MSPEAASRTLRGSAAQTSVECCTPVTIGKAKAGEASAPGFRAGQLRQHWRPPIKAPDDERYKEPELGLRMLNHDLHETEIHSEEAPARILSGRRLAGTAMDLLPYVAVVVISVFWLFRFYRLSAIDLRVPFGVASDHNFGQMLVKNFVQGRHFYVNPLLGAPGQQELYDFPLPIWLHLIVLGVIGLFTQDFGLATNIFYLVGYPLVSISCLYALRRLGVSAGLAVAGAILFAFLPFHLLRNEGHLFLSAYYLVPLAMLVCIWVGTGRDILNLDRRRTGKLFAFGTNGTIALVTCFLVGWDSPYYAFFTAFLIALGSLLAWVRDGNRRAALTAAILIAVIVVSIGIAVVPNTLYVRAHGPSEVAKRQPVESEMFALTLAQLVAPVSNHRLTFLSHWKAKYNSHALLVNENDTAALGIVGVLGMVALFGCLLGAECSATLYCLAILTLGAFLLGTMGGLGALFSFTISPEIRAYNRISVDIAFLCIAAFMLVADRLLSSYKTTSSRWITLGVAPLLLIVLGIHDQVPRGLMPMPARRETEKLFASDAEFVKRIEAAAPNGMIFQLPYFPFPESWPVNQLADYEELKGYLHSDSLRWSYGSMKLRETDKWISSVSEKPIHEMLSTIATKEFTGLYIDRNGYKDHGVSLESAVKFLLEQDPIVGENGRLSFFRLDRAALASLQRQTAPDKLARLDAILHPPSVDTGSGCFPKEQNAAGEWNWCGTDGVIVITNPSQIARKVGVQATFATGFANGSLLHLEEPGQDRTLQIDNGGKPWNAEMTVGPGTTQIHLRCGCRRVVAPNDSRALYLQVLNLKVKDAGAS